MVGFVYVSRTPFFPPKKSKSLAISKSVLERVVLYVFSLRIFAILVRVTYLFLS